MRNENSPRGWNANVEAYEMSYLLIVLKNDSMNLLLDTRCPKVVAAVVMWMHKWAIVMHVYTCHHFLCKILAMCLIKARISDGGTHAQLSQRVWSDR
jgi:hypothetical protein